MFVKIIVLLSLFAAVALSAPQICRTQGDCSGKDYCVYNGNAGVRYCVPCRKDIDCKVNEYCSTNGLNLNQFGTCRKFSKDGEDCIIYDNDDLRNDTISDSLKCAMTYTDPEGSGGRSTIAIDKAGQCISGKCRICNYATNDKNTENGQGAPRQCVYPGKYVSVHSVAWNPHKYYEDPVVVWLAIMFVFIVLITAFHILGLVKK
ncbi:hypothetical protein CYY_003387 [Polysphondylium violaceum]|uniref:Uncharacterized protein n=1 Tax=Polysphondylium violaceum TaxID=133409 RepID=A0A8J4PWU3_9MYCE|nr:hypothetical protein CYY_003387 [Polysphondylium violaceum]